MFIKYCFNDICIVFVISLCRDKTAVCQPGCLLSSARSLSQYAGLPSPAIRLHQSISQSSVALCSIRIKLSKTIPSSGAQADKKIIQ